jgi:hypothetical protein
LIFFLFTFFYLLFLIYFWRFIKAGIPGGWLTLESSMPKSVDVISFAKIGVTSGTVELSTVYNTPTGGTWYSLTNLITSEPVVLAIAGTQFPDLATKAYAMNMHTKMFNSTAPLPLRNLLFCYGNQEGKTEYEMNFVLDLGGITYNLIQISILENAATLGDAHGNIEVIDFGIGPFTGMQTLSLVISGYYGLLNLGIRFEKNDNTSYLYEMKLMVLPVI